MKKILFVCYGNICRSPMAEFIFKDYILKNNLENKFMCQSRAVSNEEIGNDMYYLSKKCLDDNNIPYTLHEAKKFTVDDYLNFDLIFVMDDLNLNMINQIKKDTDNKYFKLLDDDIKDPWYTRNFNETYNDILKGIKLIIDKYNV